MLYQLIFRLFLSRMNPETAHHLGMFSIKAASNLGLLKLLKNKKHSISALGLEFTGPFGVAAGFDKNGEAVKALGQLGFSHVEIGTVTAVSQPGNEKPRLFRLKADRALINRMGFNNDGAQLVAKRLEKLRKSNSKLPVIGVNIGKSKITAVEDAVSDYQISAKLLAPWADYLAVNVSSPNTPGLRSLQDVKALEPILVAVLKESLAKPVLVKIAPDLSDEDILEIAKLAKSLGLAGVIATNTTIARDNLKTDKQKVLAMGAQPRKHR